MSLDMTVYNPPICAPRLLTVKSNRFISSNNSSRVEVLLIFLFFLTCLLAGMMILTKYTRKNLFQRDFPLPSFFRKNKYTKMYPKTYKK